MATVSSDEVESTKTAILKVIRKPIPTDKLLQRPPFKFIQDVTLAVIKATKFRENLYTTEEATADFSKNRDGKISFLAKAIAAIEEALGEKLDIKASKVIAGLETDKTNIFLTKFVETAIEYGQTTKPRSELMPASQGRKVSPVGGKRTFNLKQKVTEVEKSGEKSPVNEFEEKNQIRSIRSAAMNEQEEPKNSARKSSTGEWISKS